ncbi:MAG: N-acyl-D-amino-acid deacylase [Planctomycetaceae bacterium]|nr:N-acyl-D-amino-acid deacylase [Planctomycetaceae bacterium]
MTLFDTIIRNGAIIDGTKRPRYQADMGLQGERIGAIGDLDSAESKTTIDASGLVVAPGFIDVHNHSDGWLLKTPHLSAKTLQGFTTEVLMVDGISYAPVNEHTAEQWLFYLRALDGLRVDEYRGWQTWEDYMRLLDRTNAQNSAAHLPYANIRSMVCGFGDRRVDDFQMRQIRYEIRRGMEAGAVGLSTGLDYIVQCYATTDELVQACEAMADYGGIYVTHVRYKKGLLPAIREAIEIGRRAGVAVHISHLKFQEPYTHEQILELFEEARREIDITYDAYPYQAGSTMLNYLMPSEAWQDGPLAALDRLTRPETRTRFREGIRAYRLDLDHIRIAWVAGKENAVHQGKTLAEFVEASGKEAADALLELLLEERLAVLCVMDEGDDELVNPFLQHDLYMMGTDGIYFPDGQVHPRMFGSVGRVLGPCVRDKKLFTLEEAVAKLSAVPARRFKLLDRGMIRENAFADLVVFDPNAIVDQATFAKPSLPTVGISHVLTNGTPIVHDGEPIAADDVCNLPGRFLQFNR